jgi:hypothetical protein
MILVLVFGMSACTTMKVGQLRHAKISRQVCQLGETKIIIQREDYGRGKIYVHPHADETTALEAARLMARAEGGQVITLIHDKSRLIHFAIQGHACQFDPNRVFTDKGIKDNLKLYGCDSQEARVWVRLFAQQFLDAIPQGKIVAVHNNKQYSMRYYLPHQPLAGDAHKININPTLYYRNFFLVTQEKDFKRYKNKGFNVVLQSNNVKDDGSLSIIFAHQQYVNVEAGYDQLFYQMRMLKNA